MSLLHRALLDTWESLLRYLPFLGPGTLIAAAVQVHLDRRSFARAAARYARTSIFLAALFAALTPFCSCGTIAVVLALIASAMPWGPIVAFMVSSPLMSPGEYFFAAGVMGWGFATALLAASIALGIGAGFLAQALERKGFLKNQARLGGGAGSDPSNDWN